MKAMQAHQSHQGSPSSPQGNADNISRRAYLRTAEQISASSGETKGYRNGYEPHSISFNVAPKPVCFHSESQLVTREVMDPRAIARATGTNPTRHLSNRGNLPFVPCRVITFVCDTLHKREDTPPLFTPSVRRSQTFKSEFPTHRRGPGFVGAKDRRHRGSHVRKRTAQIDDVVPDLASRECSLDSGGKNVRSGAWQAVYQSRVCGSWQSPWVLSAPRLHRCS
jgi:hypothetical protein